MTGQTLHSMSQEGKEVLVEAVLCFQPLLVYGAVASMGMSNQPNGPVVILCIFTGAYHRLDLFGTALAVQCSTVQQTRPEAGAAVAVHVQLTCRLGSASTGRLPRPGPAQPGPGPRRLLPGSELLCSQLSQSSQLGLHST